MFEVVLFDSENECAHQAIGEDHTEAMTQAMLKAYPELYSDAKDARKEINNIYRFTTPDDEKFKKLISWKTMIKKIGGSDVYIIVASYGMTVAEGYIREI